MAEGIGGALRVGVFAEVFPEIVPVDGEQMAFDLVCVDKVFEAGDLADPGAEDAVAEASFSILVFRAFFF